MASFIPRKGPNGRRVWQVHIRRRGYPAQVRTFDTKTAAQDWAAGIEHEISRGTFISRADTESTTLAALLDRYEREITPQKRGAAGERSHIRMIRQDCLARCCIPAITGKTLTQYRDRRLESVSASTLNREINILSHVFTVAARDWHSHLPWGNPVRMLRRPRVDDRRERRLTGDEEPRLLDAARRGQGDHIHEIIVLALETAMRRGEIAAMRWEHVDRKARVLLIPETRTGAPRRVPLSSRALAVLDSLPRRMDGRVWSVRAESMTRSFERAVSRARQDYEDECVKVLRKPDEDLLRDLRFHDLRHEATSRLFAKGLNPMEVAAITGHKTLQMLKRYTHLRAEDLAGRLG